MWKRFIRILDSFDEVMEQLLRANVTSSPQSRQDELAHNCGGAALAALADALHESGGRATLIITHQPNYGVGALADRERRGQQSPYRNASDEQ